MFALRVQLSALLFIVAAVVDAQNTTHSTPNSSATGTTDPCVMGCSNLAASRVLCSEPNPACICGSRAEEYNQNLMSCIATVCRDSDAAASLVEQCPVSVIVTALSTVFASPMGGSNIVESVVTVIFQSSIISTPPAIVTSSTTITPRVDTAMPAPTGMTTITGIATPTGGNAAPPSSSGDNSTSTAVVLRLCPGWVGTVLAGSVALGFVLS